MSQEHWLLIHAAPWSSTGKAVPLKLEVPGKGCCLCLWCSNNMLGRCFREMQYGAALGNNGCDCSCKNIVKPLSGRQYFGSVGLIYKWYLEISWELVIFWVKTSASPAHWACSAVWKGLFIGPNSCVSDKEDLPFGLSYQQAREAEILVHCLFVCWVPSAHSGKNKKRK